MKTCPYCAKEINSIAIVCKHCGRDIGETKSVAPPRVPEASRTLPEPSSMPLDASSQQTRSRWIAWGLGAIAVLLVVWLGFRATTGHGDGAAAAPVKLSLGRGQATTIPSHGYVHYDFTLPERNCSITGHIVGLAGGNFQAFLIDDTDFRNWQTTQKAQVYWQTDKVGDATINAHVAGPGRFHLVISNTFSLSTPKTVTVQAQADCS